MTVQLLFLYYFSVKYILALAAVVSLSAKPAQGSYYTGSGIVSSSNSLMSIYTSRSAISTGLLTLRSLEHCC